MQKIQGGGGNSLKFRGKSEEVRVGGSSSSWRLGRLLSFILSIALLFWVSSAWAAKCNFITALERGEEQTIVCYGTSLTESGPWVKGLSDALNARWPNNATVINSGMSGKNSSEGLLKVREKVISKNPDAVFIEFSMNDAADNLNLDKTAEEALVLAESNLKGIISEIKTSNPSCEIILQTMNPYVKAPNSSLSNRTGLEKHVEMYRRVAEEGGYLLIDNWPSWQKILEKGEAEYLNLVPDGLHPNEIGSWKVTLHNLYEMLELADGWIVSENTTLTADTIVDALTVADGVTLDLNGYSLICSSLAGSGTITSVPRDLTSPDTDGTHVTWSTNGGTAQNAQGGNGANLFNNTSPSTDSDCSNNGKRIMVKTANLPLAVTYDFGEGNARKVDKYKIYFARPNHENKSNNWSRGPKTWTFEGSNDGETWKDLDTVGAEDGVSWLTKNCSPKEFSFSNDTAYRFYRITFTASSDATYLELHQLEYFNTNPGELHLNVADGQTLSSSVTIPDNVRVVKEGAGTLGGSTTRVLAVDANTMVGVEVSSGTLSVAGNFIVGNKGTGTVTVYDGIVAYDLDAYIGHYQGAIGAMTVNGGSVTSTGSEKILYVGNLGNGTLTLNNGTVETYMVRNGWGNSSEGASGTINLNGGTLRTRRIYTPSNGSGTINFNGGTLKAHSADPNLGGLITSDTTVNLLKGGGTIDSSAFAIKIGATLIGEGAMRFKGGGSIQLLGANTYTGGTTIELGTRIITSVETAKDTVLGKLIIDGKTKTADENGIVVFEYSGLADEDVPAPVYKNCGDGTLIYRDGDTIKVDFKAPAWEITADTTWNELVELHGVPAEDATVIINAASACKLTINTDVTVAQIVFTGTNPDVVVQSGVTVTADTITFSGSGANYLKNDGVVILNGTGKTELPFHNDSRGAYYINNGGRLNVSRVTQGSTTPGLVPEGTNQFVCVASGATYDVRNVAKNTASVRLAAHATVANGSDTSVTTRDRQIPQLILDGDATAKIYRSFGLVGANNSKTRLDLGSHTLTINGGGTTYSFFLDNTTVSGTGKILVAEGKLCACESSSGEKFTLEIGESGQLVLDKASGGTANTDFTVGDFVNNGTDNSSDNGGSLVVKGTLSPGNAIKKLKLANGATVRASVTKKQTVTTTFAASGTITVDASEITKEQLNAGDVAVLTVPAAFNHSGATWGVTGTNVDRVRAKWRVNEDGTKTLYIARNDAFRVIIR